MPCWHARCCAAPGGAGKPKKVATTAGKLIVDADSVSGSVHSPRSECRKGRQVKLRSSASGKSLGNAKTDAKGRWLVTIQLGAGTYFADVENATRKGTKKGKKVTFHCRAVKSAPVTL